MAITHNAIPSNLRLQGFFFEFDPSLANNAEPQKKLVVLGNKTAAGTAAPGTPMVITRPEQADEYFGRGSLLASMLHMALYNKPQMQVVAIASDDLAAGQAARGSLTVNGAASTSGLIRIGIGGQKIAAPMAANASAAVLASGIVATINAATELPVIASTNSSNSAQVDIVNKNKGEHGNDIDLTVEIEAGQQPSSPTFGLVQPNGGVGNPDVLDSIAAMGDEWYNWIVMPWTDSDNLGKLDDELNDRYSPMRQIGCRTFTAMLGTNGQLLGFGNTRNSYHVTTMGAGMAPQPAYIWAVANAVAAGNSLQIDPSRQLHGLELRGILPPAPEHRFTNSEKNQQLFDGISTYDVDSDGTVRIHSQITNYQENAQGLADDSVLYIVTPETYDAYRFEQHKLFSAHARDKLTDDGNKIPAGQPIMTPKKAKGLMLSLYRYLVEEKAWCQNFDRYKETILVEKQGNRLAIKDQPEFIDNLRQVTGTSQIV